MYPGRVATLAPTGVYGSDSVELGLGEPRSRRLVFPVTVPSKVLVALHFLRRLDNFTDKQEQEEYRKLLNVATTNFSALHPEYGINNFADFIAEDKTVLEYLADSDNAPRLIRHFIAKPESLLKIMRMASPLNKYAALDKMETAMVNYFKTKNVKATKPLPSTGRVVNNKINTTSTEKWDKKWSAADALNYLKNKGQ